MKLLQRLVKASEDVLSLAALRNLNRFPTASCLSWSEVVVCESGRCEACEAAKRYNDRHTPVGKVPRRKKKRPN